MAQLKLEFLNEWAVCGDDDGREQGRKHGEIGAEDAEDSENEGTVRLQVTTPPGEVNCAPPLPVWTTLINRRRSV